MPVDVLVVNPDFTTVAKVPVVDMKYWYPVIPMASVPADRLMVNAPVALAPLAGLVSVGIGAMVSRYNEMVFWLVSPLVENVM